MPALSDAERGAEPVNKFWIYSNNAAYQSNSCALDDCDTVGGLPLSMWGGIGLGEATCESQRKPQC